MSNHHNLLPEVEDVLLKFIDQSLKVVSVFDPSVFDAFHTESEQILGKYVFERDGDSVLIHDEFQIQVYDTSKNVYFPMDFEIAYHFVSEEFRSFVVYGTFEGSAYPVHLGSSASPYFTTTPSRVKKPCFSLYTGKKKYLISNEWYDIVDFEAKAFQDSTVNSSKLGLSLAQTIIEKMGVK